MLEAATQAQMAAAAAASSSPAPVAAGSATVASDSAAPASAAAPVLIKLTIIGKAELETLRQHNRILRSNNVSIFKQRNELEVRALAAERRVEQLERELQEARGQ